MSDKTCWLVDEENGIATDGKRYWCVKETVPVAELKAYIEERIAEWEPTRFTQTEGVINEFNHLLARFCEPSDGGRK